MKRIVKFLILCLLIVPLTINAETSSWTPAPTWKDGTAVSATDAAKFTFYLRIWRGTNPATVPMETFYFGETRNGGTMWGVAGDNTYIMTQANKYVTPPLVPGDNVIVSVSAAFNDGTQELDSWTTDKPGMSAAYKIPGGVVIPAPTVTLAATPASVNKGLCSTLSWGSTNATTVSIDQGVGVVATTGTKSVCPTVTTTYLITATGAGGTKTAAVTVIVIVPPVVTPGCNPPTGITIKQ